MLNKFKKIFLVGLMLLVLLPVNVFASENRGLYVKTDTTKDVNEYAVEMFNKFLIAQDDITDYEGISLATGIKLYINDSSYDYYVYPVVKNNHIISTIHISKDKDGLASTYTKSLAEELESLRSKTSISKPLILFMHENAICAEIGDETFVLENHSETKIKLNSASPKVSLYNIDSSNSVNIFSNLIENTVANKPMTMSSPVYKMPWTIYETQGNNPWCASITTANIVNNIKKSRYTTSAKIRSFLGDNDGLTISQVYRYLKLNGFTKSKNIQSGSLSFNDVYVDTSQNRPIYASLKDSSGGHAIAIIGYNQTANAYYIHNPWRTYTETMAVGGTYVTNGHNYKWTGGAIYNIR